MPKDDANKPVLYVMEQPATFAWPVKVPVPVEGKYLFAEFTATFPNMTDAQVDELLGVGKPPEERPTDKAVAAQVLLGFAGVKQPDGTDKPCTPEAIAALLAGPRVAQAVTGTFLMAVRGLAAEKN